MKLNKFIAIFFFVFFTNLFASDCSNLLKDGNPRDLSKVLNCGFICQKDEDCEEALICSEMYSVNIKYTAILKKYLSQFQDKECSTDSMTKYYRGDVCFEPKCVANRCLRKSVSCQIKNKREQQITDARVYSQSIITDAQSISDYNNSQPIFRRFDYAHYKSGQRCTIEESELNLYIKNSKLSTSDPLYKSSIVLDYAKEQLKKKNNEDKIYCSAAYFINTPIRIVNSTLTFKESFPVFYNSALSYMTNLFAKNGAIFNEAFSKDVSPDWIMFLTAFNSELKFMAVIPAPLLKQIYSYRKFVNWNEKEADFYLEKILQKGVKVTGISPMIYWLEKNPEYYKKNVIPLFSSQDKTMNDSYDSKSFSNFFISKSLLMANLDDFVSIFMKNEESSIKCYLANQVLKFYDASNEQKKLLSLENSPATCVKKAFTNIKSLTRADVNGCPSFSFNNLNISLEHFNELKKISDNCSAQCNANTDCSYIQKGCIEIIPVNTTSKKNILKNIDKKELTCNSQKYTPPVQMECHNKYCRQMATQCGYDSFLTNIKDYITKNDFNECKVNEDCITHIYNTKGLQNIKYTVNKSSSSKESILKYVADTISLCESQGQPIWKNQSEMPNYKPFYNICANNKCIITDIYPGRR